MKLIKNFPKKLFSHNKTRSKISRSENTSFGSSSSDPDSQPGSKKPIWLSTPTSVLPNHSSDVSTELNCKITMEELEAILTRVGSDPFTKDELLLLLNEVDVDGDGCISLEEFSAISSAFDVRTCDEEMRVTFDFFDVNHDGKITAEELFNVFKMIGDGRCTLEDCRRMIRGVDKNGDGFVCFEDFCVMMEQQKC